MNQKAAFANDFKNPPEMSYESDSIFDTYEEALSIAVQRAIEKLKGKV